jgi:hypothetical protein
MDAESTFVAINITDGTNRLLNPKSQPILFWWDGTSSLRQDILTDGDFIKAFTRQECLADYAHVKASWFRFLHGEYTEEEVPLQDAFTLEQLTDMGHAEVWEDIADRHLAYLWECSFGKPDGFTDDDTFYRHARRVYAEIERRNPDRVTRETVVKYIFREATVTDGLNEENAAYVQAHLEDALK